MECHSYLIVRRPLSIVCTVQAVCSCGKRTGELAYTLLSAEKPSMEAAAAVLKMLHADELP
jgi:hypothetical protein